MGRCLLEEGVAGGTGGDLWTMEVEVVNTLDHGTT
jgi:hypothetical protein